LESGISSMRAQNKGGLPLDLNSQSVVFGQNGQKRGGALLWVHAKARGDTGVDRRQHVEAFI